MVDYFNAVVFTDNIKSHHRCEVSLWLAEQMASDLQKAFTKLNVMAVSSNKVLGLFGQEQSIPSIGFPISRQSHVLTDSIVIIVSHR